MEGRLSRLIDTWAWATGDDVVFADQQPIHTTALQPPQMHVQARRGFCRLCRNTHPDMPLFVSSVTPVAAGRRKRPASPKNQGMAVVLFKERTFTKRGVASVVASPAQISWGTLLPIAAQEVITYISPYQKQGSMVVTLAGNGSHDRDNPGTSLSMGTRRLIESRWRRFYILFTTTGNEYKEV